MEALYLELRADKPDSKVSYCYCYHYCYCLLNSELRSQIQRFVVVIVIVFATAIVIVIVSWTLSWQARFKGLFLLLPLLLLLFELRAGQIQKFEIVLNIMTLIVNMSPVYFGYYDCKYVLRKHYEILFAKLDAPIYRWNWQQYIHSPWTLVLPRSPDQGGWSRLFKIVLFITHFIIPVSKLS